MSTATWSPPTPTCPHHRLHRDLRIGGNAIWPDEFYDGRIDEIRIDDRALTATQITTDMNTAVNP